MLLSPPPETQTFTHTHTHVPRKHESKLARSRRCTRICRRTTTERRRFPFPSFQTWAAIFVEIWQQSKSLFLAVPTVGQRRSTPLSVIDWKTARAAGLNQIIEKFAPKRDYPVAEKRRNPVPPRNLVGGTRVSQSNTVPRARLCPCLSRAESSFGNVLDRENSWTEINRQIQFIRFTTNSTITCSGLVYYLDARVIASPIRRTTVEQWELRIERGKELFIDSSVRVSFLFFSTEEE